MTTYKAPDYQYLRDFNNGNANFKYCLFLGGSIEMGKAEDWQTKMEQALDPAWMILNPRRDDWDSSWVQSLDNPQFNQQVTWELDSLYFSTHRLFYFSPGTQSPSTLLELGLFANQPYHTNTYVVYPEGFWRKGNVDMICHYHGIFQLPSLDEAILTFNKMVK
jgi:hypothetical protein